METQTIKHIKPSHMKPSNITSGSIVEFIGSPYASSLVPGTRYRVHDVLKTNDDSYVYLDPNDPQYPLPEGLDETNNWSVKRFRLVHPATQPTVTAKHLTELIVMARVHGTVSPAALIETWKRNLQ
jgi:hypothetical protein